MKPENIIEINITTDQTLSDVSEIYPLPSDAIFHKRVPGLGATHGEINAPRHSIIVLPNRPVIEDKVAKHNKANKKEEEILGIYKGITVDRIADYMSDNRVKYKKLLVTPESYDGKLKNTLSEVWDHIKANYYLLVDECERTIQDKDYREKISAPFDDFFTFKNKGMISATTLPFSDPRFNELTHYIIKPDYSYQKDLKLVATNNVVAAFKNYLKEHESEVYFIFLSSIKAITALIENLGIEAESKIHCSSSRARQLEMSGFTSSGSFNEKALAKYNFFTSRFYSGLDMKLPYKADVLMITEVCFAEHSILDPQTEIIQIVGRFRNGCNSITHITNFNPKLEVMTEEQIRSYLAGQQEVYKQILKIKQTSPNPGAQDAIKQILSTSEFAKYFHNDGGYNWFMYDNFIQEQRVLSLYKHFDNLINAYEKVSDHFKLTATAKDYLFSDKDRLKLRSPQSKKEEYKQVVKYLVEAQPSIDNYVFRSEEMYDELEKEYQWLFQAFYVMGEEGIAAADYTESKIKRAVEAAKRDSDFFRHDVLKDIKAYFKTGQTYANDHVKEKLRAIYAKHGIKIVVRAGHIERYFEVQKTTITKNKQVHHAVKLIGCKIKG